MISPESYSQEWIATLAVKYPKLDKILIEKAIRALTLLDELRATGLNFVFKGGTALMLMDDKPRRLSIDIDVIVPEKPANIVHYFNQIIQNGKFSSFEEEVRETKSKIDKSHYKFFYAPTHQTHSNQEFILLDVLFADNPYQALTEVPVKSPLLNTESLNQTVMVPTVTNILGDKLTAFAPNTTGIPYYKGNSSMSLEIMKQLFDIASLFDKVDDVAEVREIFYQIAGDELQYRNLNQLSPSDVLEDIIQTALGISLRGKAGNCKFREIQDGIKRVKHFIINERFTIDNAITAAAKAAYLAVLIKNGSEKFKPYSNQTDLSEYKIQ